MRVSQLLHAMGKDDIIAIDVGNKPIIAMRVYKGTVRGVKKDDPINKYNIKHIFADEDTIFVLAERSNK